MIRNFALIALTNIRHRKLRSFLTIIAIVIGIAAVISLVSISQGMQKSIQEQFEQLGIDKVLVMPGGGMRTMMMGGTVSSLTEHDINVIEHVRGVKFARGMVFKTAKVEFRHETRFTYVIGLPTDPQSQKVLADFLYYKLETGRTLQETDRYKAMVGYLIGEGKLFGKKVGIHDTIVIEGKEFGVVGIVGQLGNRVDDTQIYIPLDAAREVLGEPEKFGYILVQTQAGYDPGDVAEAIERAMRKDRNLKEGEEDFDVQTSEQLMQSLGVVLGIIQIILIGIAGISLLVGGIGIMNTMYTAVLERTREIGVMKAIGARNSDVLMIFLLEAGIIGLVGGVLGTLLGIGMGKAVEIAAAEMGYAILKVSISAELIATGLLLAFIVGCISGVSPARRASKLQPADALRYE